MQIVLGYIFFERHTETILKQVSKSIAGDTALVLDWVERDRNFKRIQLLSKLHLSLDIQLDKKQKKLKQSGIYRDTWLHQFLGEALSEEIKHPYFLRITNDDIYIDLESKKGTIKIKTLRKRLFSRTTPLVIIWTTASAIILFAIASLFMRNQIRPIRNLAKAAEAIGKNDYSVNIKPEGSREVRIATYAFLHMRDRMQRQLSERLEMLAGVSHDLRTPLTRMKLQLALMPPSTDQAALQADVIAMQQMVEGFLAYAQDQTAEENHKINLSGLLEQLTTQSQNDGFIIKILCDPTIIISIKPILFNRCLTNILLNCKRYAKQAAISVNEQTHHVVINIDDDGPGIPASERLNVFKPFYRLDTARNLDETGVGLGLTIARDAVRAHGGRLKLSNSPLGGLRVSIWIPI